MNSLVDRRLNGRNKSAANRERFLRRYKDQIRHAVHGMIRDRSIQDMDNGGNVDLPARDISEPSFHHGAGGDREVVHPGNREFARGDTIDRPKGGQGEGGGDPGEGSAVDQFTFSLSRAEFLNLFFEDMALPHLARTHLGEVSQRKWQRAGYTTTGSPSTLSIGRTLKSSLARRVGYGVAARAELDELQARLAHLREHAGHVSHAGQDGVDATGGASSPDMAGSAGSKGVLDSADSQHMAGSTGLRGAAGSEGVTDSTDSRDVASSTDSRKVSVGAVSTSPTDTSHEIAALEQAIAECRARLARVPFLDDLDLRYRNRVSVAMPVARAVMFCLMDVSGSMDERKKDLAKRFFTLLYLFLSRKYEHVDLVFIRHTDDAEEVDEQTFFHDPKSGGTIVLSALALMRDIVRDRYPPSGWNVYAAQASDGDSFGSDAGKSARFLAEKLLPDVRYYAYIEIPDAPDARKSSLWSEYEQKRESHFAMRRISHASEIYPVFHDLFKKETA